MQQWWNGFVDWYYSDAGWRVISGAIIPFLAIVVAGIVAAGIGRGSTRRILSLNDRERRASAVTAMIGSARRAAVWNTLSVPEQRQADYAALESDIRLRLLSVTGAALASDWAAHEITQMKKNAVSFSFQAEQSLLEFRNRLVDWHARPARAKKLFKNDLDSWAYDTSLADQDLAAQQQAWAAQQATGQTDQHVTPQSEPQPASRREATTRREAVASGTAVAPATSVPPSATPSTPALVTPAPVTPVPATIVPGTTAPTPAPAAATGAAESPLVVADPVRIAPVASTGPVATGPVTSGPVTSTGPVTAVPASGASPTEAAVTGSATTGENQVVEESLFPSPVPVSKVRERINPPTSGNEELR